MATDQAASNAINQSQGTGWKVTIRTLTDRDQQVRGNHGNNSNFGSNNNMGYGNSQGSQYQNNKRNQGFGNNNAGQFNSGNSQNSGSRSYGQNQRYNNQGSGGMNSTSSYNSMGNTGNQGYQGGFNKKPYQNQQQYPQSQIPYQSSSMGGGNLGFGNKGVKQPKAASDEPKTLADMQILVRELWIGGLGPQHTKADIQRIMSQYGELENINLVTKTMIFAYVKYTCVRNASKAFANLKEILGQFRQNNPQQVKMFFSDPQRRYDIVGDRDGWQYPDDCTQNLYIGFRTTELPRPRIEIENYLKKAGQVIEIDMKVSENKVYFVVKYSDLIECQKAWKFLRENRQDIGDATCEVAMILNPDKIIDTTPKPGSSQGPTTAYQQPYAGGNYYQPSYNYGSTGGSSGTSASGQAYNYSGNYQSYPSSDQYYTQQPYNYQQSYGQQQTSTGTYSSQPQTQQQQSSQHPQQSWNYAPTTSTNAGHQQSYSASSYYQPTASSQGAIYSNPK